MKLRGSCRLGQFERIVFEWQVCIQKIRRCSRLLQSMLDSISARAAASTESVLPTTQNLIGFRCPRTLRRHGRKSARARATKGGRKLPQPTTGKHERDV